MTIRSRIFEEFESGFGSVLRSQAEELYIRFGFLIVRPTTASVVEWQTKTSFGLKFVALETPFRVFLSIQGGSNHFPDGIATLPGSGHPEYTL